MLTRCGDNRGLPMSSAEQGYEDEYTRLPEFTTFREGLTEGSFRVPSNWAVAVTDVIDSTAAVRNGKYKNVNTAGALPIIAISRLYGTLKRPFVFGGDGMTYLIDPDHVEETKTLLSRIIRDIETFFDIRIRAAVIPVSRVRAAGGDITVSKMRVSPQYLQAFFQGNGLSIAEEVLKHPRPEDSSFFLRKAEDQEPVNYQGFSCRWQDIPSTRGVTAALIVAPRAGDPLAILDNIEEILGSSDDYHPLDIRAMKVGGRKSSWQVEYLVKNSGKKNLAYRFGLVKGTLLIAAVKIATALKLKVGYAIYRLGEIREQNKENADFRKFDGSLKIIFSAPGHLVDELQHRLHLLFEKGLLYYGLHRASGAHMTCIATVEAGDDLHFVDATDGGYSFAAAHMKNQMRTGLDKEYIDRFAGDGSKLPDPWAAFAEDYEEIFPLGQEARSFFAGLAAAATGADGVQKRWQPKNHLDLGCASGQLSRYFVELGWNATGVDKSRKFVETARNLAREEGVLAAFYEGDIFVPESLDKLAGRKFTVISCLGNTIAHASSLEDVTGFLRTCRDHLVDGGMLVLGLLNFDSILEALPAADDEFVFPIISSSGRVFERSYRRTGDGKLEFSLSFAKFGRRVFAETLVHLPIRTRELAQLIREAGYSKVDWFADFRRTPLETGSGMLVVQIQV